MFKVFSIKHKLPEYSNTQMKEMILDKIHDKSDRKIMYLKLVDGCTIMDVARKMNMPYSTVRDRYYINKQILFPDTPG